MIFNLQFYENHKSDQLEKIRHTNWDQSEDLGWVCGSSLKALGGDAFRNFAKKNNNNNNNN